MQTEHDYIVNGARPRLTNCNYDNMSENNHKTTKPEKLYLPFDGYQSVSPKLAQYWLSNFNYKHQRKIRSYHVTNLANEIIADRFREKTQITICELHGGYFITNGQHTLSAIVKAEKPMLLSVVVVHCDSMEDVANDFARHDTHLTRQVADALVAHEMDAKFGVTKTELKWITAASLQYAYMVGETATKTATQISHDQKILLLEKHGDLILSALRTMDKLSGNRTSFLTRKTTLACAAHVCQWDNTACEDFYGEISRDDGLRQGDPRKTLLTLFQESNTPGGGWSAQSTKKLIPDHMFIKAQAIAFNYYIAGKQLKLIRPDRDAKTALFKGPGIVKV